MLYTQNLTCCCYIFLYIASSHTNFYTLSLHDALPISLGTRSSSFILIHMIMPVLCIRIWMVLLNFIKNDFVRFSNIMGDRKSTRLNSSHVAMSYAVFFLKKKNTNSHDSVHRYMTQIVY